MENEQNLKLSCTSASFRVFGDVHLLVFSIVLNWVVGPFLMFALSTLFFKERNVRFMSGLNLVGCAR